MKYPHPSKPSDHPMPNAHEHRCPNCARLCVYEAYDRVHKCPWCYHVHGITADDYTDYIHSPGGDEVENNDEEMKACVIVAEAHAYAWRNKVELGVYRMSDRRKVYSGRDDFGHIILLFNYRDRAVLDVPVDESYEWESVFRSAWGEGGATYNQLIPIYNDKSRGSTGRAA